MQLVSSFEGQALKIQAGQTLRVSYSFSYKVTNQVSVPLWASLYARTAGILNRIGQAQAKTLITLEPSFDWQTYQGQVDIAVGTGVGAGTYGLIVELPGFRDAEAKLENVIEVTPAPGLVDMIAPLLAIAVLGMAARMTTGMTGEADGKDIEPGEKS